MSTANLNIEITQTAAELSEAKRTLFPQLRFQEFDEEWKLKTLSEVANKITDGTHDTPKPTKEGVPFLTAIHIKDGFIDYNNCYYLDQVVHNSIYKRCNPEKDDLLIVNIGAGTATCAINSVDYEFSLKNVALVKPNKELINGKFLAQIQRKKTFKIFNQLTSGGAQPFLSLREIGRLKIIHPTLLEQQKIASFLSAVDEKIQQLSRKKELLEQYKKGVMQQLFSGKLRFKDENRKDYTDWEEKNISSICKRSSGKSKSENITEDGENIIVDMGSISRDCKLIGNKRTNCQDDYLQTNELVMVKDDIGGGNIIGKVVMIPFNNKYVCGDHVYRLKVLNGDVSFIYFAINSYEVNKSFRRKANGTAQIGINNRTVDEQKIPFPCFAEQQKIAKFLSSIDVKIESTSQQIIQMQSFKKGLLQQIFC